MHARKFRDNKIVENSKIYQVTSSLVCTCFSPAISTSSSLRSLPLLRRRVSAEGGRGAKRLSPPSLPTPPLGGGRCRGWRGRTTPPPPPTAGDPDLNEQQQQAAANDDDDDDDRDIWPCMSFETVQRSHCCVHRGSTHQHLTSPQSPTGRGLLKRKNEKNDGGLTRHLSTVFHVLKKKKLPIQVGPMKKPTNT